MRYQLGQGTGAALRMERKLKRITKAVEEAEQRTLADAKAAALGFSSARAYNMKDKRQRARAPYSRRNPRPPLPPFLINQQTGDLNRSWKTRFTRSEHQTEAVLFNTSKEAAFFGGEPTNRMMGRPIRQEIIKVVQGPRRERMRAAVRKGLKEL